jgi:hypothetical protein
MKARSGAAIFLLSLLLTFSLFGCAGSGDLDASVLSGSILFVSPVAGSDPDRGVWKLNPATGDVDVLFYMNAHEKTREAALIDFAYSPSDGTLFPVVIRDDDRGQDETVIMKFEKAADGTYSEGTEYDYTVDRPRYYQISYVQPISRLAVLQDKALDILNTDTGEREDWIWTDASNADWNEDFTEILAGGPSGLYRCDVESETERAIGVGGTDAMYANGYNEIVYRNRSSVWKYNFDTKEKTLLCQPKHLSKNSLFNMTVSPDRRYVAAYCAREGLVSTTHEYIIVIEISTGKYTIVYSEPRENGVIDDLLWIDD